MLATLPPTEGSPWTPASTRAVESAGRAGGWRLVLDEQLARHTSMGVGGPCPIMLWPRNQDELCAMVAWMGSQGLRWHVLGGGSNLLVPDDGVDAPVINMTGIEEDLRLDGNVLRIPASVPTARALRFTISRGLGGLVWSAGLPGTIGGAAAGNAGCWGGDMQRCTADVTVIDAIGEAHRIETAGLQWAYRSLTLPDTALPWTIVTVGVNVEERDPERLGERYEKLQRQKREHQPVGARNSGCIFRNPTNVSAGQLIDAAGCKGLRVGDAIVSERHANFIVNLGSARACDIEALVDRLISRVQDHSGVVLKPEIRRW